MEYTMNMCERVRIFIKGKGRVAIFKLQHIVYLLHYGSLVGFLQTRRLQMAFKCFVRITSLSTQDSKGRDVGASSRLCSPDSAFLNVCGWLAM